MELKEFIKTVISDITDAVSDLQNELDNGTIVSPSMPVACDDTVYDVNNDKINRKISQIDFDIAITIGDSDTVGGSGKAGIQIFSAKVNGESKSHTENVSRITFTIPIALPSVHIKSDKEKCEDISESRRNKLQGMRKALDDKHLKETTNS